MSARRFRVTDSDSDSDDDFPPISGFSQPWNTPHRLVIDDPSSGDSEESGYTTAREEEVDLNVPFENLALSSSPSSSAEEEPSPAVNNNKNQTERELIMASPSALSVAEKLLAGGIPHVISTTAARRDSTGVSSLEAPTTDDESHLTTPPKHREPSLDNISEALVDTDEEKDDTSTVVQEGRTKTPKQKQLSVDDDDESEALVCMVGQDNTIFVWNKNETEYSSARKTSTDYKPRVYNSQKDTTSTLHLGTPKREPSSLSEEESQALVDSSPDNSSGLHAATPKHEPSLCEESEALVDSSPDDTTTVLKAATPKRDPSLCEESEALVDSSHEETSTILQVATPNREPSLCEESEALVDSSPEETSTAWQKDRARTPKRKSLTSKTSEPLVGSSPDNKSTVLNIATPKRSESPPIDNMDEGDDSMSTVYPAETPWKGSQQSLGTRSIVVRVHNNSTKVHSPVRPATAPRDDRFMQNQSEILVESSLDDSDSSSLYPAETPERESSLDGISKAFAAIELDEDNADIAMNEDGRNSSRHSTGSTEQEEKVSTGWEQNEVESPPAHEKMPTEVFEKSKHEDSLSDLSNILVDESPLGKDEANAVVQESRESSVTVESNHRPTTVDSPLLVDTSSERDDSSPVGPYRRTRETLLGVEADELVDTSTEEDDTLTVVQEGRVRTPKRPLVRDDDSDSDSFSDTNGEQSKARGGKAVLKEEYDDCAWDLDEERREVFLSDEKFSKPDVSWPKLRLPLDLYESLYSHQKMGVQWMAGLHNMSIGGILGDDMGMGKTYQSLTFLGGLMRARTIRNALVVAPLSVLQSWEKEARVVISKSCVPRITIIVLSSEMAKKRRQRLLQEALSCSASPYLVITTYGMITSSPRDFISTDRGHWGYVVLDEGHKIKNPSAQVSKACEQICSNPRTRRLVLTGTLIQNNLKELWSVVSWATSGQLFGTLPKFKNEFAVPIEEGRHKSASEHAVRRAELANSALQEKLRPHYLQRLKSDFMKEELPTKKELVVWTHLSSKQRETYEQYIAGEKVQDVLRGETKSPLEVITWLKKLCGHPLLVEIASSEQYERGTHVDSRRREELLGESAKLQVLVAHLGRLCKGGHRTLIFSQSTRMLDIIEHVLCRFRLARIDGSTKGKDRQHIVDAFNSESSSIDAMLLSTKAAGLGLTLTGADRVIVFDPSWNPAEDAQAIDRAYRIGQRKDVKVFRFITAGTVEEAMYSKQVHKDGIRRAVTTSVGNATERFFEKKDLRKLFELGSAGTCEVLDKIQVNQSDTGKRSFLEMHPGVVGVSSHDDIYLCTERKVPDGEEYDIGGTPFGGAAVSATKSAAKVMGKSARVLAGRKIDFTTGSSKENRASNVGATKSGGRTSESAINVDMTEEEMDDLPTEAEIETLLNTADNLREQGNEFSAFSILIELLKKKEAVKGKQKLRMHHGLAELGRSFGWLYNESNPST